MLKNKNLPMICKNGNYKVNTITQLLCAIVTVIQILHSVKPVMIVCKLNIYFYIKQSELNFIPPKCQGMCLIPLLAEVTAKIFIDIMGQ